MLYASKRELHSELARNILHIRQRELSYYTTNVNNIGMQSALLAGFAFTILANHKSRDVLLELYSSQPDSAFVVISYEYMVSELDAQEIAQVVLELMYLTSTISAMGSTLYTLYICLITSILGPGLALRGPEGSMDKAVIALARVNREVIGTFRTALSLFQFSIAVNVRRGEGRPVSSARAA